MTEKFDVIVIGGGHAGIEASLAAKRFGCRVLMVTTRISGIGEMSCNPAIGGIAKGTVVREIDAMDGSMAKAADLTRLQFRMLNRRKGPAVWGPRVQSDAGEYARVQRSAVETSGVSVLEDEVLALEGPTEEIAGVVCRRNGKIEGKTVVLAAGTFLRGRLFRGEELWSGGRAGDIASDSLERDIVERMFHVERFKTGTPARVLRSSVNTDLMDVEEDDKEPYRFSYGNGDVSEHYEPCYTVSTNSETAKAVHRFIDRSPLLRGRIQGTGPRYCPSFEDKVVKFPQRKHHKIYVEPMGFDSRLLYLNGLSTSLPREAQDMMVRSLSGFEEARIVQYGYAVEYSYFHHSEISSALRLNRTSNVFVAGQICGTSGYEEAAGLGLVAGTNAARLTEGKDLMVPSRLESYIGVMIDDIVDKGLDEPYRLFSSRAENRLHIRQDNADRRLYPHAFSMGIVSSGKQKVLDGRIGSARRISSIMEEARSEGISLKALCRRPDTTADRMVELCPQLGEFEKDVLRSVILDERYRGYIERSMRRYRARKNAGRTSLESIGSYMEMKELCWEAREVLERERPENIGQAERLPGVRPTDIQGIIIHLARERSTWNSGEDK